MRSGFSTTIGVVPHSGWTATRLQNTFRSQNCTKIRLWVLFGGLPPVSSTTASSIRAKRLRQRATVNISTICTRSCSVCAWHYSTERGQFCSSARRTTDPAEVERIGIQDSAPSAILAGYLAPDYHFFKHFDNFLQEKCFKSRDDVELAFDDFIASRTPDFYTTGINKLVSRWQKCIESTGFYFD